MIKKSTTKMKPEMYVKTYECAKDGMSRKQIALSFGVNPVTFKMWMDKYPALREAYDKGKATRGTTLRHKFQDYVYKHLPDSLHDLWSQICAADDPGGGAEKTIARLTKDCGRRTRQYIWVHALMCSNFNYNEACRKSNISRVMVQRWVEGDSDFAELVEHLHEMKKDFVEGCLLNLVGQGDTGATIFAAKTLLRDRGYNPSVTVEHKGTIAHAHLSIEAILGQLPVSTKRQVLEAMRRASAGEEPPKMLPPAQSVEQFEEIEDAEFEEVRDEDEG